VPVPVPVELGRGERYLMTGTATDVSAATATRVTCNPTFKRSSKFFHRHTGNSHLGFRSTIRGTPS
jgi:hypothetical protein